MGRRDIGTSIRRLYEDFAGWTAQRAAPSSRSVVIDARNNSSAKLSRLVAGAGAELSLAEMS